MTLCGEMGGKPLDALALLAIGYRSLSMSPSSIGPVKAMVLALDIGKASRYVTELIDAKDPTISIREKLRIFADEHGVPL